MNGFVIYSATGQITRFGYCPSDMIAAQAQAGESALDVTGSAIWDPRNSTLFYVAGGVLTQRVAITYTCPSTATVGTAVTLSAPAGAAVTIDDASVGAVDSTGSDSITFSDAGTYTVSLSLWPYLDTSFDVVAS